MEFFRRRSHPPQRMIFQPFPNVSIPDLILYVTGNDPAQEKKKTGIAGIQQGKAVPGMLIFQYRHGFSGFQEPRMSKPMKQPGQQIGSGKNDHQVSQKRSELTPGYLGYGHRQVIQVWL